MPALLNKCPSCGSSQIGSIGPGCLTICLAVGCLFIGPLGWVLLILLALQGEFSPVFVCQGCGAQWKA